MSIELKANAANPKPVINADNRSARSNAKPDDAENADTEGAFSSLLTSFDSQVSSSAAGDSTPGQGNTPDSKSSDEDLTKDTLLQTSNPIVLPDQGLPSELAMLLSQAGAITADKLGASNENRTFGVKGGVRLSASMLGDKGASALPSAEVQLGKTPQDLSAFMPKSMSAGSQSTVSTVLTESRAFNQSLLQDASSKGTAIASALLVSGMGEETLRPAERSTGKNTALPGVSGLEGALSAHALQAGSSVDAPSVMVDTASKSLEAMVADTVSYWVTQGIQSAELKLDGFGGSPVEVTISLNGDEAHIGFRTDQPEIRQILEGAAGHLKDLLVSEGLVLSGVSVGASGQEGAGSQQQRSKQSPRQVTIETLARVPAENRPRIHQPVGKSLDIFV